MNDDPSLTKRLLLLAYYVPPLGLSGVQRVAKLARYLGGFGWAVDVVAPSPGAYFAHDPTLLDELDAAGVTIYRTRSLDPTRIAGALRGAPARGMPSPDGGRVQEKAVPAGTVELPSERRRRWLGALTAWAFVPDNKIGWLPFAVATANARLATGRYDAVLASAPPYTGLLAGALAASRHGVPLVLDLRDDWLGNPRHVYPTRLHRRLHAALERWAFVRADAVLTISEAMRAQVAARHPDLAPRLHVVPQGYDEADFAAPLPPVGPTPYETPPFSMLYTGVFYDAQRPDVFLDGLARFCRSRPDASVVARFAGLLPESFDALAARLGVASRVERLGYLPHGAAVAAQRRADLLWMTVGRRPGAEGISTGKLFEYVGSRRPILGLVPDGTARDALRLYGAAYLADPDDPDTVAAALERAYDDHLAGTVQVPDEAFVRRHGRRALAGEVAKLLDALVR